LNSEKVDIYNEKFNILLSFDDKIFYDNEKSLSFDEKEIEILKEIHDLEIVSDEEELEEKEILVSKAKLEDEKYKYMIYGGIISASVLITFYILLKIGYISKYNPSEKNNKKRN